MAMCCTTNSMTNCFYFSGVWLTSNSHHLSQYLLYFDIQHCEVDLLVAKWFIFGCCKCFHSLLLFCSLFCPSCRFSHISNERRSRFPISLRFDYVHFILFAPILFFLSFFCSFWLTFEIFLIASASQNQLDRVPYFKQTL